MMEYFALLIASSCMMFGGGVLVGLFWRVFRDEERSNTDRFPRPGTQPARRPGLRPYRKSPEMLTDDE